MNGTASHVAVERLPMMGRRPTQLSRLHHRPLAQRLENMSIIPDKPTLQRGAGPDS